jgi:hypothetical protein
MQYIIEEQYGIELHTFQVIVDNSIMGFTLRFETKPDVMYLPEHFYKNMCEFYAIDNIDKYRGVLVRSYTKDKIKLISDDKVMEFNI